MARGRDIVARWCDFAERRLEYLTELFETGRWRRYHTEQEFLENIQEAKTAVETWRDLLTRIPAEPPRSDRSNFAESDRFCSGAAPSAADRNAPVNRSALDNAALDIASLAQRYPLLRNVM